LRYLVSRSLRVISRAGQGRDLVRAFPGYPIKLAEEEGLVMESGAFCGERKFEGRCHEDEWMICCERRSP
jgi:hypothetical protein